MLESLIEKENIEGSGNKLSKKLDVSPSLWSKTKQGKREIGIEILTGVVLAYPELETEVINYLRNRREAKGNWQESPLAS